MPKAKVSVTVEGSLLRQVDRMAGGASRSEVFETVAAGNAETGIVPIYNSTGGFVNDTLDELLRRDFFSRIEDIERSRQIMDDAKEVYFEANLFDLINAVSNILKRCGERTETRDVFEDKWTVSEKIEQLLKRVEAREKRG